MDELYLQMLMELLAAQQGGGMPMGPPMGVDPGLAYGPGGRVPQYRPQYTGFMSDGTVRDYVMKALPDMDRFSADAFFDMDPRIKGFMARAVSEGDHDPYNVYALMDDDAYRRMLLDMAMAKYNLQAPQLDFSDVPDRNGDGVSDVQDMTYDEYYAAATGGLGDRVRTVKDGSGKYVEFRTPYQQILERELNRLRAQLDDAFTQAAPSLERNINTIDFTHTRMGGMPYPGMGGEALDYAGTGPGFSGGGGGGGGGAPRSLQAQLMQMYGASLPKQPASLRRADAAARRRAQQPSSGGQGESSSKGSSQKKSPLPWYMRPVLPKLPTIPYSSIPKLPGPLGIIG